MQYYNTFYLALGSNHVHHAVRRQIYSFFCVLFLDIPLLFFIIASKTHEKKIHATNTIKVESKHTRLHQRLNHRWGDHTYQIRQN